MALLMLNVLAPDGELTLDYDTALLNAWRNELLLAGWTLHLSKKGAYRSMWRSPGGYETSWLNHDYALQQAHGLLEQGIIT